MDNSSSSILIVDDEEDACRNMADILGDCGYRVDVAFNGASALELARNHTYDVALLDLKMPGMDGLTLYRKIKKLSAGTVAIIVTAYATNATAKEALTAGAISIFPKPVDFPNLLKIMDRRWYIRWSSSSMTMRTYVRIFGICCTNTNIGSPSLMTKTRRQLDFNTAHTT